MDRRVIEVYEYDELSDKAKEYARSKYYDINIDHEWWDLSYDDFHKELSEHVLKADRFYFDLGRRQSFDLVGLWVEDMNKLLTKADINLKGSVKSVLEDCLSVEQTRSGYGSSGKVRVTSEFYRYTRCKRLDKVLNEVCKKLEEHINDLRCEFLKTLESEYDYLTSDEAIEETIKANDYRFLSSGRRWD